MRYRDFFFIFCNNYWNKFFKRYCNNNQQQQIWREIFRYLRIYFYLIIIAINSKVVHYYTVWIRKLKWERWQLDYKQHEWLNEVVARRAFRLGGLHRAFHLHWRDALVRWSGTGRKVETDNSGRDVTVARLNKSFCATLFSANQI